jgi:hypothetical protein
VEEKFSEVRGSNLPRPGGALRYRDGATEGFGSYNSLGRAGSPLHLARPSLCALEALRWLVGGETMTTPGGAGTTPRLGV